MPLRLEDLAALDAPGPSLKPSGEPLSLPVVDIDEDAEQPRQEFDADALQELAATIRERGVRQPISVRPHPQASGRWVLNFGARRLRASKLAGLDTIPAFVDTTADDYDQVIENEQREGLKPLELALFVQKRLVLGERQADIARQLGKSRQWVTLATALIEAPDWLLRAYREGRCRGMNELYEVRRLHDEHADAVEDWVARQPAITRDHLARLRTELSAAATSDRSGDPPADAIPADSRQSHPHASLGPRAARSDLRVHVVLDGQDCQLLVSAAPEQPGHVYVRPLAGGPRRIAPAAGLKLIGFVDV